MEKWKLKKILKTSAHAKVVPACKSAPGQGLGHLFFSHKVVLWRDFVLKGWTSLTSTVFSKSCSGFKKCSFKYKYCRIKNYGWTFYIVTNNNITKKKKRSRPEETRLWNSKRKIPTNLTRAQIQGLNFFIVLLNSNSNMLFVNIIKYTVYYLYIFSKLFILVRVQCIWRVSW